MVVPYVIRDDQEAKDISVRLRNQIGGLEFEISPAAIMKQEEQL
jgi:hypothetical protein